MKTFSSRGDVVIISVCEYDWLRSWGSC